MLYPKAAQPFSMELFQNPTSEYRGTPFWAWNCKLEEQELLRQIEVLKEMGFGGFHMHVRTGMDTPYLSGEFLDLVEACVEKARREGMLAWLYDEDRWPSGAAGGIVTKAPALRQHYLLVTRHPYTGERRAPEDFDSRAFAGRTEAGRLVACYDVRLDGEGKLEAYRRLNREDPAEGIRIYAYLESAPASPWFNNQAYVDTLNPRAIAAFLHITHDAYAARFQKDFGGVIPAIFTDEPQFTEKGTLSFAGEDRDVALPWTPDLEETYRTAYSGEELLDTLPELLWDRQSGPPVARYRYHDHIAARFTASFADQCGAWCEEHGLMLTGHMMNEPTLYSQTLSLGDAMRSYRAFALPGIDMLCDRYEFTTAKQAQSAARQYGRPGVLSELYGVTNWDFDFRGHKLQGDWQAALGVTVRVPHLSWVSMGGEAKRDYPASINYQAPWYREYAYIEDHFARVNTAMTRGQAVARVGVIHPVESYWLQWGPAETTLDARQQMEERFESLTGWLLEGQIDFDFLCESTLPEQCEPGKIGETFPVGRMAYEVIVVPGTQTLRGTTLERLERFRDRGGRILFLGESPEYADAKPSQRGEALCARCERIGFDRVALLDALAGQRDVEIRGRNGGRADNLLYQLREEEDCSWLFIAQSRRPDTKDVPLQKPVRIAVRGEYGVELLDTLTGEAANLKSRWENGWTVAEHTLCQHDSLLLRLTKGERPNAAEAAGGKKTGQGVPLRFLEKVPVTLEEPNVLLLDLAEYALDGEDYRPREEILRLDNVLRGELSWPRRGAAVAQPWVEQDKSTPHKLALRYTFCSEEEVAGVQLAMERPEGARIRLNGAVAETRVNGWYVDKAIKTIPLPGIAPGENVLEIVLPYGRGVDVEAVYLLGDFGVGVEGVRCTLTPPVRELAFGDITRQGLPFYGGNIVYHLEAELAGGRAEIAAPYYRGHLLAVEVNGERLGRIAFAPYRLNLEAIPPGRCRVDLRYFGSRINTFGQLHFLDRRSEIQWWGPDSWHTTGDEWSYEYRFWEQGVLKSPEILQEP